MPNEALKKELEANSNTVPKITVKKHIDGLRSGMRNLIFKSTLFQVAFRLVVAKYILPTKGR